MMYGNNGQKNSLQTKAKEMVLKIIQVVITTWQLRITMIIGKQHYIKQDMILAPTPTVQLQAATSSHVEGFG
jgi:hypothetical protein